MHNIGKISSEQVYAMFVFDSAAADNHMSMCIEHSLGQDTLSTDKDAMNISSFEGNSSFVDTKPVEELIVGIPCKSNHTKRYRQSEGSCGGIDDENEGREVQAG